MSESHSFWKRVRRALISTVALISSCGTSHAELWPAGGPSLGGAIAAKAIAAACPNLMSDEEIADLDFYIKKRRAEIAAISAEDAASVNSFMPALEAEYTRTEKCTDESEEMAKDMLERVQDLLEEGY